MFNSDGAPLLHTPRKLAPSLSRPAIERGAAFYLAFDHQQDLGPNNPFQTSNDRG